MEKGVRRGLLTRFFHVSDAGYSFWECGVTNPRPEVWPKIVEVLEDRADLNQDADHDVGASYELSTTMRVNKNSRSFRGRGGPVVGA